MITKFGLFVRQLRLLRNEVLKDMADKLEISSSYLSSVENGKRKIPLEWADKIKNIYNLENNEYLSLLNAIDLTNNEVTISLNSRSHEKKDAILSFARKIDDMDDEDFNNIKKLLK